MTRTLAEFETGREQYRLATEAFAGNPRRYVRLEERDGGEWKSVGRVELHPVLGADREGRLADEGVILEWTGYCCHRHRLLHRLTVDLARDDTLAVRHERARVARADRAAADTPDWGLEAGWRISPDGVRDVVGGGPP